MKLQFVKITEVRIWGSYPCGSFQYFSILLIQRAFPPKTLDSESEKAGEIGSNFPNIPDLPFFERKING